MSFHEIFYNYPNISLNASDITKDSTDSNTFDYISMPIINEDTFVYTVDNNSTVEPATKIYLRKITTDIIPGFANMDQVLIIEQYNNTSEKYYTAFKLTVDSPNGTDKIDTLLKLTSPSTMELDLNEIIERPVSGTCNVYTDTTSTKKSLFVFADVDIKINTALNGLKNVSSSDPFYITPTTTGQEILVVNAPDKIEVECTPVVVDGEANELLYGFSKSDIADYSTLQSTTLFYFFAFTMTILSFVIPPLYKLFVIDFINYASYAKTLKATIPGVNDNFAEKINSKQKGVYLHEWNLLLIFFNLLVMFAIFMTAISSDKTGLTVGVFYIIVFIFSFSLIYMKTNDKGFMTTNLPKPTEGETAAAPEIDYDASYDWTDRDDTTHSWKDTLMYIILSEAGWKSLFWFGLPLLLGLGFGWTLQPSIVVLLTFSCSAIIRLIFHSFVIKELRTEIAKKNVKV